MEKPFINDKAVPFVAAENKLTMIWNILLVFENSGSYTVYYMLSYLKRVLLFTCKFELFYLQI